MISRNDLCWCDSGKKWKKCHFPVKGGSGPFQERAKKFLKQYGIVLKTPDQIEGIRRSCKLAANILDTLCHKAKAGVTTDELNTIAEELIAKAGAKAAPLGYGNPPFPKSICTSLNDVICHGIPDDRPLQEGDIMNIDVTCILGGYFGDCSKMVIIGQTTEEKKRVVDVSYECLMRSIAICKPGVLISEIGDVIEAVAKEHNCSVVNQFVGHGVGLQFHEAPQVPHHTNRIAIPLEEGMTFTIEPMINAGERGAEIDSTDQWTAYTVDRKPSAQWEHTILITATGHEILTKSSCGCSHH